MSANTIQIPSDHIQAIRESLLTARHELGQEPSRQLEEIDDLLEQIDAEDRSSSQTRELTGSRALLWRTVYDSVCGASERLADDCNEYWRGVVDPAGIRAQIAALAARFDLLESLGPPPGEPRGQHEREGGT